MLITFRKMKPEDAVTVAEIEKANFSQPWTKEAFANAASDSNYVYLVALDNDIIVGYAGCTIACEEGDVTNIAVSEAYRKMGIGKELLKQLVIYAKKRGALELFLEVRSSNIPARALYGNMGFEAVGTRKNFYQKPTEDAVLMKLIIK